MPFKMKSPTLYKTMEVSRNGYRRGHSPTDMKIIPSNEISMLENDGTPLEAGPILGVGNKTGNKKIMEPGETYTFEGDDAVIETPLAMVDVGAQMMQGYKDGLTASEVAAGATQVIDGVACDAMGKPVGPTNPSNSAANYDAPKGAFLQKNFNDSLCLRGFRGSCRPSLLDKIKNWSRRKRLGDKVDNLTDFLGVTDFDRDGNIITRGIDNIRRNRKIRKEEREQRGPRDTWFRDADNDGNWFTRGMRNKKGCPWWKPCYDPGEGTPEGIVLEDDIWEEQFEQDDMGGGQRFA